MTSVTIIGSSHVAALKTAWARISAELSDRISLRFFAAPQPAYGKLRLEPCGRYGLPADADAKDAVTVEKVNGATSVDLNAAEHVVWVSQNSALTFCARLVNKLDVYGDGPAMERGTLVSRQAFSAFLGAHAERALPSAAWGQLKARLMVTLTPRLSETVTGSSDPTHRVVAQAAADGDRLQRALSQYEQAYAQALARNGHALLPQPVDTLAANGLTAAAHCEGSVRLRDNSAHPAEDHAHMNTDFGERMLRALFDRLAGARAAAEHQMT
ncbi:hypothetical protein AIOL_000273 [Candidatus Rhodobacter oscarellae]|uniref:Uncharacterized protein n=1 Tax=Candidatus Rhodobacter oscarellae TaxID=1675527 RepID=A0A0J9EBY1_9RHOB|nr:hypothetical protein [Candidatus Rhodobacter lobularis]KMW60121.1 hypothetical protein AIOL_000273 [Candidatus Rhodobacter lobularis]